MSAEGTSRRDFLHSGALLALALVGCRSRGFDCNKSSGLSTSDVKARDDTQYVEPSPTPSTACDICQYWIDGNANSCGGCRLLRGPIHPKGTCRLFVGKV